MAKPNSNWLILTFNNKRRTLELFDKSSVVDLTIEEYWAGGKMLANFRMIAYPFFSVKEQDIFEAITS